VRRVLPDGELGTLDLCRFAGRMGLPSSHDKPVGSDFRYEFDPGLGEMHPWQQHEGLAGGTGSCDGVSQGVDVVGGRKLNSHGNLPISYGSARDAGSVRPIAGWRAGHPAGITFDFGTCFRAELQLLYKGQGPRATWAPADCAVRQVSADMPSAFRRRFGSPDTAVDPGF